jgi:acyl-CoA thioesterase-1
VPFYPFCLDGVVGRRALIQADGLHPNRAGVAVIVERITPAVRQALRHRLSPPRIPLRSRVAPD